MLALDFLLVLELVLVLLLDWEKEITLEKGRELGCWLELS